MGSLIARAGRLLDALFLLRLRRKVPGLSMAPGAVVDRRAHIVVRGPATG